MLISYGLAIGFCLLGILIVYMRTRYAMAFYLVIFGSMIVAAYKMGLVHEKLRVVTPKSLSSIDAMAPCEPPMQRLESRDPSLASFDPGNQR